MSAQLEPRRFNVTEYYQMAKAGVLKPGDRLELIDGEIVKMRPTIEVYSDALDGRYRKCWKFKRGEVVKSPTVKGLALKVNERLG